MKDSVKYLDLARELKKMWNIRVIVILIVFDVLGTVCKDLEKRLGELEIRGRIEIIQTTALLKLARILGLRYLKRFTVTHSSVKTGVKYSQ